MSLHTRFRNLSASLLLALAPLVWPTDALAQAQAPEPELKAAIIANMLLFIEWPDARVSALDEITVCHLDSSPVADALTQLNGKSVKGKLLKVATVSPDNSANCHALYLAAANASMLPRFAPGSATNGAPYSCSVIRQAFSSAVSWSIWNRLAAVWFSTSTSAP